MITPVSLWAYCSFFSQAIIHKIADKSDQRLGDRKVAQRQMIEVVTAVHRNASYLLLDEPTTALEARQIEQLLVLVRRLAKEQNLGVLLIDHKLDEVFAVADHVTALADGRVMLDAPITEVQREEIVSAIIGTSGNGKQPGSGTTVSIPQATIRPSHDGRKVREASLEGPDILVVKHLAGKLLRDVSLTARAGRVLGVYGLVGSGRSRFLRCLAGLEPFTSGYVELAGNPYHPSSPASAIRAGIGYLSEERKRDGFIPQMNATMNSALPLLDRFSKFGILRREYLQHTAMNVLQQLDVHGSLVEPITLLSGGNQQKAIFGRLVLQNPLLMLLDEPTKGVDIGAKREIYRIVHDLVDGRNLAAVVVSSEEEEILDLCDEVVIFYRWSCDGVTYPVGDLNVAKLRALASERPVVTV